MDANSVVRTSVEVMMAARQLYHLGKSMLQAELAHITELQEPALVSQYLAMKAAARAEGSFELPALQAEVLMTVVPYVDAMIVNNVRIGHSEAVPNKTREANMESVVARRIFIGFTSKPKDGWKSFFSEPVAAANLKDPVKIQEDLDKKRRKQEAEAALHPMSGTLTSLTAIDSAGNKVFSCTTNIPGNDGVVSMEFIRFLNERFPGGLRAEQSLGLDDVVIGFGAKVALNIAGMEVLHSNAAVKHDPTWPSYVPVPIRIWKSPAVCDPMDQLLSADERKDIGLDALCDFLGLTYPDNFCESPEGQALLAKEMCRVCRFYDTFPVAGTPPVA